MKRVSVTFAASASLVVALALSACGRGKEEAASSGEEDSTAAAPAIAYWTCSMHPSVREAQPGRCPLCGMDLTPVMREAEPDTAGVDLTFSVSEAKQQLVGVTFTPAERRSLEKTVQAYGRVDYDETRQTVVNLRVSGWIEKLFVDYTGEPVRKGAPLLSLYSPDLVSAQSEYLLAKRSALRHPAQDDEAELVRTARERLLRWQFTEEQIRALELRGEPETRVTIHSPASGIVVEKMAVEGMRVEPGMDLYRIADLSTVWIQAEIYESELQLVRPGQEVTVTFPTLAHREITGRVAFIDPVLDPRTRTARVRIEVANRDGELKPEMYAQVLLRAPLGERLVVPKESVLRTGEREIVFVDRGEGVIELRLVHTGVRGDHFDEILHGLAEGERVVSSANFLIDAESRVQGVLQRLEGGAQQPSATHAH